MAANRNGSLLAADFGSVHTRVVLIDLVDGEYRLVAQGEERTTLGYPIDDVSVGLDRALRQISEATGRRFYNDVGSIITPEQPDRSGVDYFLTTASAGRPIKAVMIGLMPHVSIDGALQAVSGAYVEPAVTLSLEDGMTEEERLNAVLLSRPDLIFIAGGTDGGAKRALKELIDVARLAVELLSRRQRPVVLYAGNRDLVDHIRETFDELTTLFIAENVRPTMAEEEVESAQFHLGQAYDEHKERHGEGFNTVSAMSSSGILPNAQSHGLLTEYFARIREANVISVDVGSSVSQLTGYFYGTTETHIRTDMGLGHSASSLLEIVGEDAIAEWLPFYPRIGEINNYALNKTLRPATVPFNLRDLYIEHAFLKASVQKIIQQARPSWGLDEYGPLPPVGVIIGSGAALTATGNPAFDTLLLLDALQPTGITEVKADPYGLIPALGAIAKVNPTAVVQILDGNNLEHLGTVVNVTGTPKLDQRALKLKITTEDGEVFEHEVLGGHVWRLPLPAGHSLKVQMSLSRGLHIQGKRKVTMNFTGGTAGLIFDVRGRPFATGKTVEERAQWMPQWIHEITDNPLQAIPERWKEPIEGTLVDGGVPRAASSAATGGGIFGFLRRREQRPESDEDIAEELRRATQEVGTLFDEQSHDEDELDALFAEAEDKEKDSLDEDLGALRDLL